MIILKGILYQKYYAEFILYVLAHDGNMNTHTYICMYVYTKMHTLFIIKYVRLKKKKKTKPRPKH